MAWLARSRVGLLHHLLAQRLEAAHISRNIACLLLALVAAAAAEFSAVVRSAGFADGNAAEFWVAGQQLQVSPGQGFNVAVLGVDGTLDRFSSFSMKNSTAAEELVMLMASLENGTHVLVAVQDDAADGISDAVRSAVRSCGGYGVDGLRWRYSYALVGVKGGPALAEQLVETTSGDARVATLCGTGGLPGIDIVASSAGWEDGNTASVSLDGTEVDMPYGHGWNVVFLNPDRTLRSVGSFNMEANGSSALVEAIAGLPVGALTIAAVQDDGRHLLSAEAMGSLASCGATMLSSFHWRYSYALIGVKGGAALAENMTKRGDGSVTISARYGGPAGSFLDKLPTTTTVTTTTTTSAPQCAAHECGIGLMHKAEAWNVTGDDDVACCMAVADGTLSVAVRSAGWGNGNLAEFYLNGERASVLVRRGLNILELRPDGSPKQVMNFDTHSVNTSAELVSYIAALDEGARILVAALDEPWLHLEEAALIALESCGARRIRELRYRGGYALVGQKGGAALSEAVRADGGGIAVASGHLEVDLPDPLSSKPLCPAASAAPPVKGWMSGNQFQLEAGCRYSLFERSGVAKCLQGKWMVIVGGSNTVLMALRLANMLSEDAILPVRDGATMGGFTFIDVIISDGGKIYSAARKSSLCSALPHDEGCKKYIFDGVAEAPPPSAGAVRITLFSAQFWDHALDALDAVQASGGSWLVSGGLAFLVQVSTWDIYCAGMKLSWCPRKDLSESSMSDSEALTLFQSSMEPVLQRLEQFCAPGELAGDLGCVVATTTFQNPAPSRIPIYEAYNGIIRDGLATRASPTLRLLDLWVMGQAMPAENVLGHGSPLLNLWNWQVMLTGMCPPEYAARGTVARFEGELCTGDEARLNAEHMTKCPEYRDTCKSTPRCEPWECANSVPCTLVPTGSGLPRDERGLCEEPLRLGHVSAAAADLPPCGSLWCDSGLDFVPACIAGCLAALLILGPSGWRALSSRLPRRLLREKPGAKVEAEEKVESRSAKECKDMAAAAAVPAPADAAAPAVESEVPAPASAPPLLPEPTSEAQAETVVDIDAPLDVRTAGIRMVSPKVAEEKAEVALPRLLSTPAVPGRDDLKETAAETARDAAVVDVAADVGEEPAPQAVGLLPGLVERCRKAAAGRRKAGDKFPLGLARFCASLHVVVGHLYAKGVTPKVYFFGWGFTWVPWFFMLSGFVLFTAHLRRPKDEGILDYVLRRSVTIYPLYAVSLIPAIAIAKYLDQVPPLDVLVAQSFLVQAWWPGWTENALQSHCWFLSAMVVYWLLFKPLSRTLQNFGMVATLSAMLALFALPWLVVVIPALLQQSLTWYSQHSWGQTETLLDKAVVFLKFHPVCYLHVFVLGMLLAKLRLLLDEKAKRLSRKWLLTLPMEFVAPLGYMGLFLVFSVPDMKPLAFKLSARLSVLLPLQAAILLGLAGLPSMPIGFFALAASWFNTLENYSYAVYVFQFICYSAWPDRGLLNLPLFLVFCVGFAVCMSILVQKRVQTWWSKHPKGRVAVPVVLSFLLGVVALVPTPHPHPADVPLTLRHDSRMLDVRLPLVDVEGSSMGLLMNPSFVAHGDRVAITARRHKLEGSFRNGWYNFSAATIYDKTWHSSVLLGEVPLDAQAWAAWPTTGEAPFSASLRPWYWLRTPDNRRWRHLCAPEEYDEVNNTLVRLVVTGPEDARIFLSNGSLSVAFDSYPPFGQEGCASGEAVPQMYLASSVAPAGDRFDVGRHMPCGAVDKPEKNWIPFEYEGDLHFVYSPERQEIVRLSEDGSCVNVYSSDYEPLARLKSILPGVQVRGNGQSVFVNDSALTPTLARAHFLTVLHLYDPSRKTYTHYAYRFSHEPPFNVLQVSEPLPLVEARPLDAPGPAFAFVSGIALVNGTVAITYGSGDREARALVMTLDRLDNMFRCGEDWRPATSANETA